ncbi:amidase [Enterovirga rhinocerotis]|uniref:Aspartyl-tRNA(Asn)/glutamyl-tRNA(Gln) amidotransferase subunit A n=1 Tax=Enterovirga rhinocerotis TaxID=1339210 RepID=A0A4R7C9Q8_9HYPH|nr:amidase [Enterovirga rhinocerotis]TDR93507.1 aspartyl-tRNA(Asn)/glutamyl-tRNA(Gln) amidotransferase subunit A [Enterovirga rhinocerotis]
MTDAAGAPLSATDMAARLDAGETTPEALLADAFARIARANAALGAFVHLDPEGAAAAARASGARQSAGARLGPLDGVPIAVKDNLWVAGMPARWGSRMWADFVPPADDIAVERLRAAGAIIVGKTNTPEFALSGRTDSPLHGPARNPWDVKLTPGGSSGGSVAAVAAGLVPLSLATDAGGSTRLPASYTGLYGMRPSNGTIPRRHGFPPMALDFQAIGVLGRSLADMALLLDAVSGPDPRDPASLRGPGRPIAGRPLRIGWFSAIGDEAVDPEVAAAVAECAALLAGAACDVVPREAPYDIAGVRQVWGVLSASGAARAAEIHPDRWRAEASRPIAMAAERGLGLAAVDYVRAMDGLAAIRTGVAETWGDVDVFLCPAAASPAWPIDQEHPAMVGGRQGHAAVQNTFATWVNAIGHPAISVPARPHADGRPLGVQIVGRFGEDATVIDVARRLDSCRTWSMPDAPVW